MTASVAALAPLILILMAELKIKFFDSRAGINLSTLKSNDNDKSVISQSLLMAATD